MKSAGELKHVPDGELLRRLSDLVKQSRKVDAVLITHIGEVDARRLYSRDASSMFGYCTRILHLSEHEAYARITVARAARRFPMLLPMLADGRLHLSGIGKLVPHLTDANCEQVLTRATHKTKIEIEELVAEIAPRPDVPAAIYKLPAQLGPISPDQLGPDRVRVVASVPRELGLDRVRPASLVPTPPISLSPPALPRAAGVLPGERPITPLSPARYKVQFTVSAALRDKLERLQTLTRDDLATVIEAAVTEKLERLESKRFALTKAPRKNLNEINTSPSSRYLPAPVRRIVRKRDGNQCTFIVRNGSRCTERRGLEFHHRRPYARGGTHSPDNLCLMCRRHNAYLAELDYGKDRMTKYQRPSDRVSEGLPDYVPGCRLVASALRATARARDA